MKIINAKCSQSPRRGAANSLGHSLLGAVAALILLLGTTAQAQPVANVAAEGPFHPGRLLIQPKADVPLPDIAALHAHERARVLKTFPGLDNLQVLELPPGAGVREMIRRYQQSGLIEHAEPDYVIHLAATPNDPKFLDGTQWALHNTGQSGGVPGADIGAVEAWNTLHSAPDIVVAVIDSGIRYTHEDLADNMWVNPADGSHGLNAVAGNNDPNDDNGHGTHVAGIIGAVGDNEKGLTGVAWRVQLMALKSSDSSGSGSLSATIECIDFARNNGAHVINASWGTSSHSSFLERAIRRAGDEGIIFVAAAGNSGSDNDSTPFYPASYKLDNVVAVAATTRTDALASYSNFGASSVHLAAPGSAIYSTYWNSNASYAHMSGTSMAAPHVAGAFALMRHRFPGDTHQRLIERVLAATDPISSLAGKTITGGRLNLHHALGPTVIADFTASATSGDAPLTVEFTDLSVGGIVSWEWDFGDGSPLGGEQHPVHTFENEGQFTVTMTVTTDTGATGSRSRVITVVSNYLMEGTEYNWINSNSMPAVSFNNGVSAAIDLPFAFTFYGQSYDALYIAAHGLIGFERDNLESRNNTDLPNPALPNAIVAPYWDDLNLVNNSSVRTGVIGGAPERRFVVSWINVRHRQTPPTTLTFQAVLHEATGEIVFQYQSVDAGRPRGGGAVATVGIENASGLIASKYSYNSKVLSDGLAISFMPTSAGGMMVIPSGGLSSSGYVGGPFSPESRTYTIENSGSTEFDWSVSKTRDWVSLSGGGGTLGAGESTTVTVSINSNADVLPAGIYLDTLSFVNLTTGNGNTTRTVSLSVNGIAGVLEVSPSGDFSSSGSVGGPFSPESAIYTLINSGDATLDWEAQANRPWVSVSPGGGTLAAGEDTTLSISINLEADELLEGTHSAEVTVSNLTNGEGNTSRLVALNVSAVASPGVLAVSPADDFTSGGDAGGPFTPESTTYTVANTGGSALEWTAQAAEAWISLEPSGGTLAAGESVSLTVSINGEANALAAGTYSDEVTISNLTNGEGDTSRLVALNVNAVALLGVLEVSPAGHLETRGFLGGPFSPDTHAYTLSNSGGEPVAWQVETDADWLEFSASEGELSAGESGEVTAAVLKQAEDLSAGEYLATITFRNPAADSESVHELKLVVYRLATLTAENSDPANGGFTLRLTGEPGLSCRIEASEDFNVWTTIHTEIIPPEGVIEFSDSESANFGRRFYRAVFE